MCKKDTFLHKHYTLSTLLGTPVHSCSYHTEKQNNPAAETRRCARSENEQAADKSSAQTVTLYSHVEPKSISEHTTHRLLKWMCYNHRRSPDHEHRQEEDQVRSVFFSNHLQDFSDQLTLHHQQPEETPQSLNRAPPPIFLLY